MTIGEKIRKARHLRGYTQAELGEMVGLNADRIQKYENNVRTPKPDRLAKIAQNLNIDISALSDINITSINDVMHIFFELEDTLGLKVDKINNQYILSFDNLEEENKAILLALDEWYNARKKLLPTLNDDDSITEKKKEYDLWRYSLNVADLKIITDWNNKKEVIDNLRKSAKETKDEEARLFLLNRADEIEKEMKKLIFSGEKNED